MNEWMKNITGTIVSAAIASGVILYGNTQTNTAFIEKLTNSTDSLSQAVTELRITVGAQNERFVTKDELHLKLRELKQEIKDGS